MDDEIREETLPDAAPEEGAHESLATPVAETEFAAAPAGPGDTAELTAIEESLREPDPVEPAFADASTIAPPTDVVATETAIAAAPPADAVVADPVSPIDLGPERRSNAWVWIGLLVGVLVAAGAMGYAWWYTTSRPIAVPDVVGKLPAQATQALNDAGLRLGKVSEELTDTAPAGTVVAQSPLALKELKPGASVTLVLAAPPATSKVPELQGKNYDEASNTLVSARLNPVRIESFSTSVAAGFVVSQLPPAGEQLSPGGSVALVVSKGQAPSSFRVPQLTGLPEQDAAVLLAGLDVIAAPYRSANSSLPAGVVITQTPTPGGNVLAGGAVQYLVSNGPGIASVRVPDVVGDTRKDAESALKAKGLKADVREVPSLTVAKGKVISQMPPATTRTSAGAVVGILVSKGNVSQAAVPDLAAKRSDEASTALTTAGFKPVFVDVMMPNQPAGQVLMQFPAAKSSWPLRFPVVCLVVKAS